MAEVSKDNLMVIKLTTQKIPEYKEVKGKDWVAFGADNLYPDYIISLFERSATNNAIITGKVNYVCGEGWKGVKKGLSIEAEAKINNFIDTINPDESLDELTEKIDLDFEMNDGFYIHVIQKKNKKGFSLYHLPFNKMRTNADESEFYYSKDWSTKNQDPEKTGFQKYPKFDGSLKQKESVFYFRILSPRKGKDANVYPLPNYIGGCQSIETEIECQNFNLAEIKTGFSAGTMISFNNGTPKPEEMDVIEEKIKSKYSGTDAAGRLLLSWSDSKDKAPEVLQLSGNDLPERYINLKKDSSKSIFTSHKVSSPELFGVQEDTVFGGRTQIAEKYELFLNTYIAKRQRILEKIFNNFAGLAGITGRLILKPTQAINTDVFSENTIVANLPAKAIQDLIAERMGIDLTKYANTSVTTQMKSDKPNQLIGIEFEATLLNAFDKIGRDRSMFHVVKSKPFKFGTDIEILESELQCFKDEETDATIIKAPKSGRIEVLYSYEWREGFNNSDLKTSREFCRELIKRDRLYTRQEIDRLSNEFNTDVWKFKGGWYTNPNTDNSVPYCRHLWRQNVVKIK